MRKTKKYQRQQKRRDRRGRIKRERKKRQARKKHALRMQKGRAKRIVKEYKQKGSFKTRIKLFILRLISGILCLTGRHVWALMSGKPGTPKYICAKCFKKSKVLWPENSPSTNHLKH